MVLFRRLKVGQRVFAAFRHFLESGRLHVRHHFVNKLRLQAGNLNGIVDGFLDFLRFRRKLDGKLPDSFAKPDAHEPRSHEDESNVYVKLACILKITGNVEGISPCYRVIALEALVKVRPIGFETVKEKAVSVTSVFGFCLTYHHVINNGKNGRACEHFVIAVKMPFMGGKNLLGERVFLRVGKVITHDCLGVIIELVRFCKCVDGKPYGPVIFVVCRSVTAKHAVKSFFHEIVYGLFDCRGNGIPVEPIAIQAPAKRGQVVQDLRFSVFVVFHVPSSKNKLQ